MHVILYFSACQQSALFFEETDFHYMFNVVWLPPNVASVINHQTLYRPHLHQYLLIWWQKMDVDGVLKYISIIGQERTSKNSTSANKLGLSESLRSHFVYFCREDHCQPPIVSRGALHRMWLCKLFSDLLHHESFFTGAIHLLNSQKKQTDPITFLDPTVPQTIFTKTVQLICPILQLRTDQQLN